jgi:hypothetical protein
MDPLVGTLVGFRSHISVGEGVTQPLPGEIQKFRQPDDDQSKITYGTRDTKGLRAIHVYDSEIQGE